MEGLWELTNALSDGTIPDGLPFLEIGGLQLTCSYSPYPGTAQIFWVPLLSQERL